jgi:hypothetical protein
LNTSFLTFMSFGNGTLDLRLIPLIYIFDGL